MTPNGWDPLANCKWIIIPFPLQKCPPFFLHKFHQWKIDWDRCGIQHPLSSLNWNQFRCVLVSIPIKYFLTPLPLQLLLMRRYRCCELRCDQRGALSLFQLKNSLVDALANWVCVVMGCPHRRCIARILVTKNTSMCWNLFDVSKSIRYM